MKHLVFSIMFVALAMISFTSSATTTGMSAFEPAPYTQTMYITDKLPGLDKEVIASTHTGTLNWSDDMIGLTVKTSEDIGSGAGSLAITHSVRSQAASPYRMYS
jgi:hypothetical protein